MQLKISIFGLVAKKPKEEEKRMWINLNYGLHLEGGE